MAGRTCLLGLVLLFPVVMCKWGDRPGQVRLSAFGSYGHKDVEHSNDPEFLATKPKKRMAKMEPDPNGYVLIKAGSREANDLHKTDKRNTKGMRIRTHTGSAVARSRYAALMNKGRSASTRVRSESVQEQKTKSRLAEFFDDPKTTIWTAMRVMRMYRNTPDELPPMGMWTSKNRPHSLLPRWYPEGGKKKHTVKFHGKYERQLFEKRMQRMLTKKKRPLK